MLEPRFNLVANNWHYYLKPPSTPLKLDLLSASKYGTPATGARCNDAQRCWTTSNNVTRKVTKAFYSSIDALPNEKMSPFRVIYELINEELNMTSWVARERPSVDFLRNHVECISAL